MVRSTEEKTFPKLQSQDLLSLGSVCFDFGGCLDGDGLHTRELFWQSFQECRRTSSAVDIRNITREPFQDAYTWMDNILQKNQQALGLPLEAFNLCQWELLLSHLFPGSKAEISVPSLALSVTRSQRFFLEKNARILERLRLKYPHLRLAVISNFTGNLETLLTGEKIRHLFEVVSDSFWIGKAKPDLKIFEVTADRLGVPLSMCLMVGDQLERDIGAAKQCGMKGAWITSENSKIQPSLQFLPDFMASSVAELFSNALET